MIFLGVLGGDPLGEWGMAKTKTVVFLAEPRGKAFPLLFFPLKINLVRGRIIGAK
jgi:hypothetical protein